MLRAGPFSPGQSNAARREVRRRPCKMAYGQHQRGLLHGAELVIAGLRSRPALASRASQTPGGTYDLSPASRRQRMDLDSVGPRGCRAPASVDRFSGAGRLRRHRRERPRKSYVLRLVAIAALASVPMVAECRPTFAQVKASAPTGAALPRPPLFLAQAAPGGPAPAREQPVGLPPVRDYEPIPELRDIYFDLGTA